MQITPAIVASGKAALESGSLTGMAAFMEPSAPALLHVRPDKPIEYQWLALCNGISRYFASGLLGHHVRFCASEADIQSASPRDRMFVLIARGQPSMKYVEETLALPGDYGWYAATQWTRVCHKKKNMVGLEMVLPRLMERPSAQYTDVYDYEVGLAQYAIEDLWLRKNPQSPKANWSALMATFPLESDNPRLYRVRQIETWNMFGMANWERRRDRVK